MAMMILMGCGPSLFAPPTPTVPAPTATASSTQTPIPTKTLTPVPTATPIFGAYPLKNVLFKYTLSGEDGAFEEFGLFEGTLLVIYSDGQLIAAREKDKQVKSKYLTTKEVCSFVNNLDELGFFSIDAPQNTEETNPLYDFGSKYQKVYDGLFRNFVLNGMNPRRVSLYEPYKDFLVRPVKRILDYVETYNPGGLKNYQPDRMLLFVESGQAELEAALGKAEVWGTDLPPLADGHLFLEGEEAGRVYEFMLKAKSNIFLAGDVEYTVTQRVLYPHESLNPVIDPLATPTDMLLPINCNP